MEELTQVFSLERLRDDEQCIQLQIPLAVWSKAWVCGRSLAGIAGSNPAGGGMIVSSESCMLSVGEPALG